MTNGMDGIMSAINAVRLAWCVKMEKKVSLNIALNVA